MITGNKAAHLITRQAGNLESFYYALLHL